jgi:hypothetical protein
VRNICISVFSSCALPAANASPLRSGAQSKGSNRSLIAQPTSSAD